MNNIYLQVACTIRKIENRKERLEETLKWVTHFERGSMYFDDKRFAKDCGVFFKKLRDNKIETL